MLIKKNLLLLAMVLLFAGCGADDQSVSDEESYEASDEKDYDENTDNAENPEDPGNESERDYTSEQVDPELGIVNIAVNGNTLETQSFCRLSMTRSDGGSVAILSASLSVDGAVGQSGTSAESGQLLIIWSKSPDSGVSPIDLSYTPPATNSMENDQFWMLDPQQAGSASLTMAVDGSPYDFSVGELRGVDIIENAPHRWQVTLNAKAAMIGSTKEGQPLNAPGEFFYDGPCTIVIEESQ